MTTFLLRHRLSVAVLSFVVSTLAYGTVSRAIDRAPRDEAAFWIRKVSWGAEFDVAMVGDSRINRGVSPAAVEEALAGKRVVNFGFSGAGLAGAYLQAAPQLLSRAANPPVIVLGVTPRSLTPIAAANHEYAAWSRTRLVERWGLARMSDVMLFLTPENPVLLFGRPVAGTPRYLQQAHPTGWLAATRVPLDPEASLEEYRDLFKSTQVSEALVAELVATAAKWEEAGIHVFALRPPTTPQMVALEDAKSGFQETAIRSAMEAAGVQWLDTTYATYETFDGNHLTPEGAIAFSRALGLMLRQALSGGNSREIAPMF